VASQAEVDLVINATGALREAERHLDIVVRQAQGSLDPVLIQARLNQRETVNALRQQLNDAVQAAQASTPDVQVRADVDPASLRSLDDADNGFRRIASSAASALGPVAGLAGSLGSAGLAAGGAVPLLAGVVAAVESIAPAAAVGTSGLLTLGLVAGTVKLAMVGVGDAIESAFDPDVKPEDLAEQLKRLAPEARKFVLELRSMRKQFKDLQLGVQNRLFKDFDTTVDALGKSVLPALRGALNDSAESLNRMALGAAGAANTLAESGILGRALRSSTASLRELEGVPREAALSFGFLAAAAGPSLERIAAAASRVSTRIADSLARAFESGALEQAIDQAVDNIAQLGRIAGNVFSGLGNIINAVSVDGQGLFSTLEKISQAFEDLTASKEFQSALQELARTMSTLVSTVLPLLKEAFNALLPVIEILAPPIREMIQSLGEALRPVIEALGPVLAALAEAFAALIPVVLPFVELALQLAADILPILTPLFELLAGVFERLAPIARQVADNIGAQLTPILEVLPGILDQLIPPFLEIVDKIFPLILGLLEDIGPELGVMAESFAQLLVELAPLLVKFLEFQVFLLDKMGPVIAFIVEAIGITFIGALRLLTAIIQEVVIPAVQFVAAILEGDFSGAMDIASERVSALVGSTTQGFRNLRGSVVQSIQETALSVVQSAHDMSRRFGEQILRLISGAVNKFRELPGRIRDALGNLLNLLPGAGGDIVKGLINGMTAQFGRLRDIARQAASIVSDTVRGALDIFSPSRVMRGLGVNTGEGFVLGIRSQFPELERAAEAMALTVPQFAGAGVETMRAPSFEMAAPVTNVFLGNQLLNDHIDVRVETVNRIRDRVTAQGMRR